MTDDHKNSIEKKPQNGQQQNISSKPQPVAATGSNTSSATVKTTIPEPQIKKVDIAIAGVT